MYSNNFAGVVQAAMDAGVPGEVLIELEECGVCSPETAANMLAAGVGDQQLQAHLRVPRGHNFQEICVADSVFHSRVPASRSKVHASDASCRAQ